MDGNTAVLQAKNATNEVLPPTKTASVLPTSSFLLEIFESSFLEELWKLQPPASISEQLENIVTCRKYLVLSIHGNQLILTAIN